MKKTLALLTAVALLFTGAVALAQSTEETLYQRITTLFENGDESIGYGGLCLGIGMDDGTQPAGSVTVTIDMGTGNVILSHEEDYCIWEYRSASDCINTLVALCGRWQKLTEGEKDSLCIQLQTGLQTEDNGLTIASADDAAAFLQNLRELMGSN